MGEERYHLDDFAEGEPKLLQVGDKPVVFFRINQKLLACVDFCPHRGGPLSEGALDGTFLTCPWHHSQFDLETGKVIKGPATRNLDLISATLK